MHNPNLARLLGLEDSQISGFDQVFLFKPEQSCQPTNSNIRPQVER